MCPIMISPCSQRTNNTVACSNTLKGLIAAMPVLGIAALLVSVTVAAAATFIVNSVADAPDVNQGDGKCVTSSGACTLRAAVQEANALAGADTIRIPAGTYRVTSRITVD